MACLKDPKYEWTEIAKAVPRVWNKTSFLFCAQGKPVDDGELYNKYGFDNCFLKPSKDKPSVWDDLECVSSYWWGDGGVLYQGLGEEGHALAKDIKGLIKLLKDNLMLLVYDLKVDVFLLNEWKELKQAIDEGKFTIDWKNSKIVLESGKEYQFEKKETGRTMAMVMGLAMLLGVVL